jgi:hypothetical protein
MILIPGFLIAILTFPGVIVHEIGHRLSADLLKVPVLKVCYFRMGNPSGYVIHAPVIGIRKNLLITVMPLIINTLLCSLITFSAVFHIFILDTNENIFIYLILAWIGISIGMHAFPSNQDTENLLNAVKNENRGGLTLFAARCFSWIFKIANFLRIIWFDAIYSIGISLSLPWLFGLL